MQSSGDSKEFRRDNPESSATASGAARTSPQTSSSNQRPGWKEVKPVDNMIGLALPDHSRAVSTSSDEEREIRIKDLDSGKEYTVLKAGALSWMHVSISFPASMIKEQSSNVYKHCAAKHNLSTIFNSLFQM